MNIFISFFFNCYLFKSKKHAQLGTEMSKQATDIQLKKKRIMTFRSAQKLLFIDAWESIDVGGKIHNSHKKKVWH